MFLPSSYAFTLALIVFGMFCWGSWASFFKAAGKARFELFYFDYAIGAGVVALLCAFTVGTLGFDGFSFMDDLLHAAKKNYAVALIAGGIFNLGNMLLLGAVAEVGMATALPIALGIAIVMAGLWSFFVQPGQNLALMAAGALAVLGGVALCASAYRLYKLSKLDELVRTGKVNSTRKQVSAKGTTVAVVAGLILGSYFPLVKYAMRGDIGVGPYSLCVMFAVGIFLSTFLYNLFFMNLPISGQPLEVFDYFKQQGRQHLMGLLSGAVWMFGLEACLVAAQVEGTATVGRALSFGLLQGAVVIAALWGFLYWKEMPQADGKVRSLIMVMMALLICGIGLMAVAPVGLTGN